MYTKHSVMKQWNANLRINRKKMKKTSQKCCLIVKYKNGYFHSQVALIKCSYSGEEKKTYILLIN